MQTATEVLTFLTELKHTDLDEYCHVVLEVLASVLLRDPYAVELTLDLAEKRGSLPEVVKLVREYQATIAEIDAEMAAHEAAEPAKMFTAIGTDGRDPVVWGLGQTASAAVSDAQSAANDIEPAWDAQGYATVEVPPDIAERILEGAVRCNELGINVTCRDGQVTGAEVQLGWSDSDEALKASRKVNTDPKAIELMDGSYAAATGTTRDHEGVEHIYAQLRDGRNVEVTRNHQLGAWKIVS